MQQRANLNGFTLIELLFVLLVATVLILMSVNQYKKWEIRKDLKVVELNVAMMMQAVNDYYRIQSIKTTPDYSVNRKKLLDNGLYPLKMLVSKKVIACSKPNDSCSGGDKANIWCYCNYDVSINTITASPKPIYQLITKAAINDSGDIDWYKMMLNASGISGDTGGKTLYWQQMPTYSVPNLETNLWIFNAQLQQFKNLMEAVG